VLKRLLLPTLLLALAAFALSACGDSESDEEQVIDVVETSVLTTDPADCEALPTLNFMEQTNSAEGDEAIKACEEDAEDSSDDADDVSVDNVEIDGANATADVAITGGSLDGQTVTVAVIDEDGDWKMDELTGFAVFDREGLLGGIEEAFEEETDSETAACVIEVFDEYADEELEELVLSNSEDAFVEAIEECAE
jgi:hypothetical protein